MVWQNSNKLLGIEGFKGVKTGITQTAGPCLCILYENT
jgi:D-alanyl-D-alanine carboxypeptidase